MNLFESRFPSTASMLLVLISVIALCMAWQSPLLSTPTLEAALFLGIFLAPLSFIAGACRGADRKPTGFQKDVLKECTWIFLIVFGYLLILYAHSLTLKSCSPSAGLGPFLFILGPQLFLNLVTGVWLGRLIGHLRVAVFVAVLCWILYTLFQMLLWWSHPSMRFFDQYWFLFTGDLLKGQTLEPALVAYRLSTLFYASALFTLGMRWKRHVNQFGTVLFLILLAISLHIKSVSLLSPSFNDRQRDYPDTLAQGSVVLHTHLGLVGEEHARAVLQEALFWLERLKVRTGISSYQPIHIWLYDHTEALTKYTGARHVHFTLPAHREIHITNTEVPHPTLGHELAHVLLAQVSNTWWGMPGIWGIVPNFGLSEGLATYVTPELNLQDDLSIEEQAAALYRLSFEKHPESLLEADLWSFWSQSSNRAYIASAALLGAFIESKCRTALCKAKMIKKLAETGDVNLRDSFMTSYRLKLEQMSLPPDALPSATEHFASQSILLATCDQPKDSIQALKTKWEKADKLGKQGAYAEALREYDQINLLELPIYQQRELTLKKAFLINTPYARSAFELLTDKPESILEASSRYGRLGFSLIKPVESDLVYDYASYLLARVEILVGNFEAGLNLMPENLPGWVGQESKRLVALAKSQTGQIEQAITEFEQLENQATRSADHIRFSDLAQRAKGILSGQQFLLGVWPKP